MRFRRRHPEVTLHFEPDSSTDRCLEALLRRRADMAFITIHEGLAGFEQRPVLRMPLVLIARRDDPLASRRRVCIRELQAIRYVSLSEITTSHTLIRDSLAREGVVLTPTARVDDFDDLLENPQVRHNNTFIDVSINGETAKLLNHPNRYDGRGAERFEFALEPGAHTREVLAGSGFSDAEIAELIRSGVAFAADRTAA